MRKYKLTKLSLLLIFIFGILFAGLKTFYSYTNILTLNILSMIMLIVVALLVPITIAIFLIETK